MSTVLHWLSVSASEWDTSTADQWDTFIVGFDLTEQPGIEFRAANNKLHFRSANNKLHFRKRDN